MRQSNVCSPVQNQACLLITSRLYDRRGLDCTSPLPLFNSLAHLVHLTATSPKIREILTRDGGLERLVRILRDFCINPPPAQDPVLFYGLQPPFSGENETPTLTPGRPCDREAAQRFSLAFQSIVNIGVRGSEAIRSRVVQAGTLEVVAALLETWLLAKGFPLAIPPRRNKRRDQLNARQEQPESTSQGEETENSTVIAHPIPMRTRSDTLIAPRPTNLPSNTQPAQPAAAAAIIPPPRLTTPASSLPSANPSNLPTPNDSATNPSFAAPRPRGRSGTIIPNTGTATSSRDHSADARDTSGQTTEDSDADMENEASDVPGNTTRNQPRPVAVALPDMQMQMEQQRRDMEVDVIAAVNMVITEGGVEAFTGTRFGGDTANVAAATAAAAATAVGAMPDETPRAVLRTIEDATARGDEIPASAANEDTPGSPSQPPPTVNPRSRIRVVAGDAGPFRQEDVLRALQLLAYLTKYPHVRQEFYKPRVAPSPPPWLALAPNAPPPLPPNTPTTLFSLVERFTFRPSYSQVDAHPSLIIPTIPPEIQSWAAVIMRNACRKDDTRGGIRQCANMLCGKWESAPREFAKCRRCRKAKYCGKECQSKAWSMGHRYWCSARDGEEGEPEVAAADGDGGNEERRPRPPHHPIPNIIPGAATRITVPPAAIGTVNSSPAGTQALRRGEPPNAPLPTPARQRTDGLVARPTQPQTAQPQAQTGIPVIPSQPATAATAIQSTLHQTRPLLGPSAGSADAATLPRRGESSSERFTRHITDTIRGLTAGNGAVGRSRDTSVGVGGGSRETQNYQQQQRREILAQAAAVQAQLQTSNSSLNGSESTSVASTSQSRGWASMLGRSGGPVGVGHQRSISVLGTSGVGLRRMASSSRSTLPQATPLSATDASPNSMAWEGPNGSGGSGSTENRTPRNYIAILTERVFNHGSRGDGSASGSASNSTSTSNLSTSSNTAVVGSSADLPSMVRSNLVIDTTTGASGSQRRSPNQPSTSLPSAQSSSNPPTSSTVITPPNDVAPVNLSTTANTAPVISAIADRVDRARNPTVAPGVDDDVSGGLYPPNPPWLQSRSVGVGFGVGIGVEGVGGTLDGDGDIDMRWAGAEP